MDKTCISLVLTQNNFERVEPIYSSRLWNCQSCCLLMRDTSLV